MSSMELEFTKRPAVTYIKWSMVYLVILALIVAVALLLAGKIRTYSLPTGAVELSMPYGRYLVGEPVTFTLKNNFNAPIYVANNCPDEPLAVYKLEQSTWVRIHDETTLTSCTTKERQIMIAAGGEQNGSFAKWKHLFNKPGTYRIVAFVEYFNTMPYQDIEIVAKPKPVVAEPQPVVTPSPTPLPTPVQTAPTPEPEDYDEEEEEEEEEEEGR